MAREEGAAAPAPQKTVLVGVTGCIAAYKSCEIVRLLQKAGVRAKVVMTEHATEFVGPTTFRALTREPVAVGLFDDLYELEPIVKFLGQLLAIGVAIYFDTRMTRIGVPFTEQLTWHLPLLASILVTGFWMAMIINMVNFIDGLSSTDVTIEHIERALAITLAAAKGETVDECNWLSWED